MERASGEISTAFRRTASSLIKLIAVVNGLEGSVRNLVLLNLDSDSSFGDLDSLLARYVDTHDQHESSLDSLCDRACEDKPESIGKGNDIESNPSFEQQLEEGGIRKGKGKGREKGKQAKRKGEAFHSQPPAYKGKREHAQLPREQWCTICWKKGHKTQACWWNSNQQHQQQHQQHKPRPTTTEASQQRYQPQLYNIDQQTTYTSVLTDSQPMLSLEHQSQASTQPAYSSPVFIARLDNFEKASSTTETWGILVDTGAATSVAPKSFASDIELSPAPATIQLTTATGKAVRIYGLKQQVEQDSLTFQRQQVLRAAFHEKNDPIFDLMPSKEEVAASGGELPSFHPNPQPTKQPSPHNRKLRNKTHVHLEYRCVVDQEAKDRASNKTSNIQLAYAYIRQPQDCEPTLILTWLESFTGLAGSLITTTKGPTAQQLDAVVTFIRGQGLAHSTLQCDGEPALVQLGRDR